MEQIDEMDQIDETDEMDEMDKTDEMDQIDETAKWNKSTKWTKSSVTNGHTPDSAPPARNHEIGRPPAPRASLQGSQCCEAPWRWRPTYLMLFWDSAASPQGSQCHLALAAGIFDAFLGIGGFPSGKPVPLGAGGRDI